MKMIFKIIVMGLLFLFLISSIGLFIFLKTFDVGRFKPQITAAAQNALGRPVNFGDIALGISLRRGIQLRLEDIVIGEHSAFGKENFLTAQKVNLDISLKDLILKRQLRILGLQAQSPQIKIIRLKDSRVNVQSFPTTTADAQRPAQDVQQEPKSKFIPSATLGLPALFIKRIQMHNARLEYIDYSFTPELSLVFDRITLKVQDFSLNKPFAVALQLAFASDRQNIFAKGNAEVKMNRLSFMLRDATARADLSGLSLDKLRRFIPQLKEVPLSEIKSGALSVSLGLFEIGPQGLMALKGQGAVTKGSLGIKGLAVPLESMEAKFTLRESVIALNTLSFSLGQGGFELSGEIKDYLRGQNYSAKAKIEAVNLAECLDQTAYPVKVKGLLFGEFALQGQGFNPQVLLLTLSGKGALEIKEGRLTDFNILKMVLDKLSFVPNLGEVLKAGLPERFQEKLRQQDTIVASFKAGIEIRNGLILMQPLNMEADNFLFQGSGTVNSDQSYAFEGLFIIPQDLSAKIVEVVPEMEFLRDETKQVRFPLKVSGKGSSVSFLPDLKQMGITAIKHKGRQELEKVLDSEQSQLIEGILDTIFKP